MCCMRSGANASEAKDRRALRVLAIVGSPRNEASWTYKGIRLIEERMQQIRDVEFEYIFVQKTGIPFCDGCLTCINISERSCPEFDKVGPIAAKMKDADALILGAPVHTFNVTGLMKNFVEYYMYQRNRPSFFGKKAVVTATASGGGHTVVLDFLEQTANAWGCDVVSRMGLSSSQMGKAAYRERAEAVAADVAQTLLNEIDMGKLQSPKFRHLMNFRAMQNMASNQKGSVNHRYWEDRNWFNAEYYSDVPINPFARIMAGYIARKMRSSTRKGNLKPYR